MSGIRSMEELRAIFVPPRGVRSNHVFRLKPIKTQVKRRRRDLTRDINRTSSTLR
jgi:hypothetical protein